MLGSTVYIIPQNFYAYPWIVLPVIRENVHLTAAVDSQMKHLLLPSFGARFALSLGITLGLAVNNVREFMKVIPLHPQGLSTPRGLLNGGFPQIERLLRLTKSWIRGKHNQ